MRRVTHDAVTAFVLERSFSRSNTDVNTYVGGDRCAVTDLRLHGSIVARRVRDARFGGARISVTLAGWPTVTTRERVNGVLSFLDSDWRVFQSNHIQWAENHRTGELRHVDPYSEYDATSFEEIGRL